MPSGSSKYLSQLDVESQTLERQLKQQSEIMLSAQSLHSKRK